MSSTTAESLIQVLMNRSADVSERDDAAMDLEAFTGDAVTEALAKVVTSSDEDDLVIESALESLGGVWARDGAPQKEIFATLPIWAQERVLGIIQARQ
ncbi:hypothetical protein [Streptomyces parvus]|uniref:hypothetical protein n=1 Tax=Streptomyces parvus TaxID=66428 RepID=UPI0033D34924